MAVKVGVTLPVGVAVKVLVLVGVTLPVGVLVAVASVPVGVAVAVDVALPVGVLVAVEVAVPVGVEVERLRKTTTVCEADVPSTICTVALLPFRSLPINLFAGIV